MHKVFGTVKADPTGLVLGFGLSNPERWDSLGQSNTLVTCDGNCQSGPFQHSRHIWWKLIENLFVLHYRITSPIRGLETSGLTNVSGIFWNRHPGLLDVPDYPNPELTVRNCCCRFACDHVVWTGRGLWLPCWLQEPGYWPEGIYLTDRMLLLYYNPQQQCLLLIIGLHRVVFRSSD